MHDHAEASVKPVSTAVWMNTKAVYIYIFFILASRGIFIFCHIQKRYCEYINQICYQNLVKIITITANHHAANGSILSVLQLLEVYNM